MQAAFILKKALAVAVGTMGILGINAGSVAAQKVDYAGKRILMTVPFAPGGGTDVYVRALQPFLEKHLPGNPTIIVLNVPGSRSIPGANRFEERATTDGTHAIAVSATTVGSFVFDRAKIKYKLDKWEPVILSPQGAVTYISPSVGVKTAADLKKIMKTQLVFGGQAPIGSEARTIMPLDLLGLNVKYVWGMNRGPVRLAFERRELTINYDSMPGYLNSAIKLVKAGKAIPLYSMGITDSKGALIRDPNVPDLPHFGEVFEMVHGKKASGPGFDAWLSVNKMLTMANKGIFLPAGTPKPILDAWRKAFVDILKDPEFEKHAAKVIEGYPSFIGEDAKPIIKDATTFSPEAWAWLKQYFKKEHNVTLK